MRRAGQSREILPRGTPNVREDLAIGAGGKTAQPTNDAGIRTLPPPLAR